jgi:uncharacterized protein YndB with AHSA1/START domain
MTSETIEQTIRLSASTERVWQAITDPDQLAQWFLPPALGAQLQRDTEGRLFMVMGGMTVPLAIFETIDAPRQITIRGLPDRLLTVTWTLAAEPDGTRVTVTLDNLAALPEETRRERLGPSRAGWEKALANLKAYIDGLELPFPQGYVAALLGYRRETRAKYAIERSIWLDSPPERVWQALTDPAQIEQWYSPGTPWRLSALEVGGTLSVYDAETDSDKYLQMIEVLDPPHQLVLRAIPEPPQTLEDVTGYRLVAEKGGTRLFLTSAGYETVADDARHQTMEQNAFGFGMMLENLQAYLAGTELPYPWGF